MAEHRQRQPEKRRTQLLRCVMVSYLILCYLIIFMLCYVISCYLMLCKTVPYPSIRLAGAAGQAVRQTAALSRERALLEMLIEASHLVRGSLDLAHQDGLKKFSEVLTFARLAPSHTYQPPPRTSGYHHRSVYGTPRFFLHPIKTFRVPFLGCGRTVLCKQIARFSRLVTSRRVSLQHSRFV